MNRLRSADGALKRWKSYLLAALIFAAIYTAYFSVASPQHEFPLSDDWAYAQTVRHFLDTGILQISDWASATVIFQTYWGSLFAKLSGGFSFTALRWSTLVFSFIACLALYDLLRQLDLSPSAALLGGITLIVNPLFMYLSYTFMSDIFYLGLMLLSLSFYIRGVRHNSGWTLLAGSLLASMAFLSRQIGAVLPIAAMLALVLRDRRLCWKPLLYVGALPLLTIAGYVLWLRYIHGLTWTLKLATVQGTFAFLAQPTALPNMGLRLIIGLAYIGLFTLPILIAQLVSQQIDRTRLRRLAKLGGIWLVFIGIGLTAVTVLTGRLMPYLSNVINRGGMGPQSLAGVNPPITPDWVFWGVTIIAPFVGACLGALWTDAVLHARSETRQPNVVLLIGSLMMAALTITFVFFWDEYLIVFIPGSIYLALRLGPIRRLGWWLGLATGLIIMLYGLIGLGDYLAWNTASWEAGGQLIAQGVTPQAIDGGFEWIGWYDFETALPHAIANGQGDDLMAWMSITPKEYLLSFEPLAGHDVISRVTYHTPLIGREGSIYVLRR